mmetsp:Transcript_63596/g.151724  ORF Transcript_63596/g.151724 Transcript_63596/m.151724 type:complete len:305 (-) Transcript_63596:127-1041(-)
MGCCRSTLDAGQPYYSSSNFSAMVTEFQIKVTRETNDTLGLDLKADLGARNLVVINLVGGGLIANWRGPDNIGEVECGDRITEVNGIHDDCRAMLRALGRDRELNIKFQRLVPVSTRSVNVSAGRDSPGSPSKSTSRWSMSARDGTATSGTHTTGTGYTSQGGSSGTRTTATTNSSSRGVRSTTTASSSSGSSSSWFRMPQALLPRRSKPSLPSLPDVEEDTGQQTQDLRNNFSPTSVPSIGSAGKSPTRGCLKQVDHLGSNRSPGSNLNVAFGANALDSVCATREQPQALGIIPNMPAAKLSL